MYAGCNAIGTVSFALFTAFSNHPPELCTLHSLAKSVREHRRSFGLPLASKALKGSYGDGIQKYMAGFSVLSPSTTVL